MYASPNPCTPQRHHGGCRRRRDLKDPSPGKAPAGPVLKDRSWVNSPMGGYAGGLDCSHSQMALAKGPAVKTTERGKRLDPDTQDPARPEGSAPVPCAGVEADRQKCHSQLRRMPLRSGKYPQVKVFTPWVPVEGDFPPIQLRNSYENTRPAKMSLVSNPCTPQRHRHRGLRHRGL